MKSISKKLSALVLMSTMLFSLAGCKDVSKLEEGEGNESVSSSEEMKPEDGAELLFWTNDIEYGKDVVASFETKYGVKVNVEQIGLDGMGKIMLDGPAGKGADIFIAPHDAMNTGRTAGIFAELDESIVKELEKELNPVAVKAAMYDGKMYGVPYSVETTALLYNKDLVKGEPAKEFEQIVKEAKEFNNSAENKFWFLTIANNGYNAYPFLGSDGFQLFGSDGNDDDNPGFNTKAFENGLANIAALKEIIPMKSEDLKTNAETFIDENFINGKTAYYPSGPWAIKKMKDAGVNFGVTTLPSIDGKPMKAFGGVQNAHVSAYSKYPKAAQLFAKFLVSKEGAEILYSKASKVTSRIDISDVKGLAEDKDLSVFVEQFKNAVPMPASKRISYYWTISDGLLSAVFDGALTPEEGAKKAQADFEALVQSE